MLVKVSFALYDKKEGKMMEEFKKITFDTFEKYTVKEIEESLPKKVREELYEELKVYERRLLLSFSNCESPIEQLMSIALNKLMRMVNLTADVRIISIVPQKTIEFKNTTYRVDFMVCVKFKGDKVVNLIIECDGHDFHEKTKEQVRRDNERTRNLQTKGYEILRFSGSEIYNDLDRCVQEIFIYLASKLKEIEG